MKKSRYNILSNFGDKHLLYNTVTGATVLLNDEYYSQYVSNDKKADIANYFSNMEKGGFYVADEIDEFARLTNIMQDSMKSNRILSLTIAPTLSCNFRCPYCYETGRKYNTMTPSIVSDKPIIIYTLEAFQQHPSIDEIYVSCLDGWSAVLEAYAKQFNITKLKRIVTGGATGQESIYNGLKAIKEDNKETKDIVVIIHDGNRPMLSQDVITDNLVKQKLFGSAVTVIPTTEVVFISKDGVESNAALNREELWRTQTPHSYRFDELWTVHNQAIRDGVANMAASCSLMQKYGHFSKGSEKNIKITTVEDIEIFKALLSAKNDEWIKK